MDTRIIWIARDVTKSRNIVADAARGFNLGVVFCKPDDILQVIRKERCDIVAIEFGIDARPDLALLRELRERLPRVTFLACTADPNVAVMRSALESGAADVLSLPVSSHDLQKAFVKFVQLRETTIGVGGDAGEVVTIFGARGGLGATTLAVNLAVRLRDVVACEAALVDLDLQRGDVGAFLNLTPSQSIASIAGSRGEVDEIFLHGTLTRHGSGVFVLAAPLHIDEAETISHDDVERALRLLRAQFRFTVVDTPRTLTGATLPAFEQADRIFVLSDLSVPGVRAAQRTFDLLSRLGASGQRAELLLTRVQGGPVPLKDAIRTVGREPFATIPWDEHAADKAMNGGAPLNGAKPGPLANAITQLAAKISGVGGGQRPGAGGRLIRRIFSRETRT